MQINKFNVVIDLELKEEVESEVKLMIENALEKEVFNKEYGEGIIKIAVKKEVK